LPKDPTTPEFRHAWNEYLVDVIAAEVDEVIEPATHHGRRTAMSEEITIEGLDALSRTRTSRPYSPRWTGKPDAAARDPSK
jgi:hypothetical protein